MQKKIIISGLGWSGSSAIIDYLFDKGCVTGFMSKYPEETRIINRRLLDRFLKKLPKRKTTEYNKYDILALITKGNFGLKESLNQKKIESTLDDLFHSHKYVVKDSYFKKKSDNFSEINFDIDFLLNSIEKFLVTGDYSRENFKRTYIKSVENMISHINISSGKSILFNNDVNLWKKSTYFNINNYSKFIVFRNPLDQFSEGINLKYNYSGIKKIIIMFKFALFFSVVSIKITLLKYIFKCELNIISFEDFLNDVSLREKIIKIIDCQSLNYYENRFKLEESLTNISNPQKRLTFLQKTFILLTTMPFYLLLNLIKMK